MANGNLWIKMEAVLLCTSEVCGFSSGSLQLLKGLSSTQRHRGTSHYCTHPPLSPSLSSFHGTSNPKLSPPLKASTDKPQPLLHGVTDPTWLTLCCTPAPQLWLTPDALDISWAPSSSWGQMHGVGFHTLSTQHSVLYLSTYSSDSSTWDKISPQPDCSH